LQTTFGGQATTINTQTVTNKVNPVSPKYVSSIVRNSSPSLLRITYNLTLANIVPAASAFTVMVNSVARSVNSITISGTRVQLTLAKAVVYGDIVTVAYTKPATNPLQSTSGGQVATIRARTVINNVYPSSQALRSSVNDSTSRSLSEMAYESSQTDTLSTTSLEERIITIYPNPASNYINVSFNEPLLVNNIIRIFNISGKIVLEEKLDSGTQDLQIPINLKPGVYIVQVGSGKLILYAQKVIVSN
jgi:uncharacterized repeat protein (TIGR02059 family)